ncbi:MAG: SURF1 family protein [Gemmatimonadales bacterium]
MTVLLVAAIAIALGRWQLCRLHARRASNAVLRAAQDQRPLELPDAALNRTPIDSGRRIIARGRFDTTGQMVLRERVQDEAPGVQIVTPFVLDQGAGVLWVLRGFVRSPDAVTPPDRIPVPASGDTLIAGLALALPVTTNGGQPLVYHGTTTWKRLDRATLASRRAGSLGVYLLLAADSAHTGGLAVVPPMPFSDGPHLSYAIQWFGIALAVLVFGAIMLWRDRRSRPGAAAP